MRGSSNRQVRRVGWQNDPLAYEGARYPDPSLGNAPSARLDFDKQEQPQEWRPARWFQPDTETWVPVPPPGFDPATTAADDDLEDIQEWRPARWFQPDTTEAVPLQPLEGGLYPLTGFLEQPAEWRPTVWFQPDTTESTPLFPQPGGLYPLTDLPEQPQEWRPTRWAQPDTEQWTPIGLPSAPSTDQLPGEEWDAQQDRSASQSWFQPDDAGTPFVPTGFDPATMDWGYDAQQDVEQRQRWFQAPEADWPWPHTAPATGLTITWAAGLAPTYNWTWPPGMGPGDAAYTWFRYRLSNGSTVGWTAQSIITWPNTPTDSSFGAQSKTLSQWWGMVQVFRSPGGGVDAYKDPVIQAVNIAAGFTTPLDQLTNARGYSSAVTTEIIHWAVTASQPDPSEQRDQTQRWFQPDDGIAPYVPPAFDPATIAGFLVTEPDIPAAKWLVHPGDAEESSKGPATPPGRTGLIDHFFGEPAPLHIIFNWVDPSSSGSSPLAYIEVWQTDVSGSVLLRLVGTVSPGVGQIDYYYGNDSLYDPTDPNLTYGLINPGTIAVNTEGLRGALGTGSGPATKYAAESWPDQPQAWNPQRWFAPEPEAFVPVVAAVPPAFDPSSIDWVYDVQQDRSTVQRWFDPNTQDGEPVRKHIGAGVVLSLTDLGFNDVDVLFSWPPGISPTPNPGTGDGTGASMAVVYIRLYDTDGSVGGWNSWSYDTPAIGTYLDPQPTHSLVGPDPLTDPWAIGMDVFVRYVLLRSVSVFSHLFGDDPAIGPNDPWPADTEKWGYASPVAHINFIPIPPTEQQPDPSEQRDRTQRWFAPEPEAWTPIGLPSAPSVDALAPLWQEQPQDQAPARQVAPDDGLTPFVPPAVFDPATVDWGYDAQFDRDQTARWKHPDDGYEGPSPIPAPTVASPEQVDRQEQPADWRPTVWFQPDTEVIVPYTAPYIPIDPTTQGAPLWPEQPGQERSISQQWFQPDDGYDAFPIPEVFDPATKVATLIYEPFIDHRWRQDFSPDMIECQFAGTLQDWLLLTWGAPTPGTGVPEVLIDATSGDAYIHLDGPFIAPAT